MNIRRGVNQTCHIGSWVNFDPLLHRLFPLWLMKTIFNIFLPGVPITKKCQCRVKSRRLMLRINNLEKIRGHTIVADSGIDIQ